MPTYKNPGPDALLVPSLGLRVEAGETADTSGDLPCPPFELVQPAPTPVAPTPVAPAVVAAEAEVAKAQADLAAAQSTPKAG